MTTLENQPHGSQPHVDPDVPFVQAATVDAEEITAIAAPHAPKRGDGYIGRFLPPIIMLAISATAGVRSPFGAWRMAERMPLANSPERSATPSRSCKKRPG